MKTLILFIALVLMAGCKSDKSKMIELTELRDTLIRRVTFLQLNDHNILINQQRYYDSIYYSKLEANKDYRHPDYFKRQDSMRVFKDSSGAIGFRIEMLQFKKYPYQRQLDSVNSLISHLKEINFVK